MKINRRKFLTIAGVTAATAISKKTFGDSLEVVKTEDILNSDGPLTGKRWAMVIDIKKCLEEEGCDKCMTACHVTHNVPKFDSPKDEVKWIWKEEFENAFPSLHQEHSYKGLHGQKLPILCNHCDNPPCVRVCPTGSTWKREDGIVMMDMHRCIGCRYCVAACPYGSRSFNWRDPRPGIEKISPDFPTRTRGVVEKCNFCAERLARGEGPACAEACTVKAITFGDLDNPDSDIRHLLHEHFTIRRKPTLGTHPEVYYIV